MRDRLPAEIRLLLDLVAADHGVQLPPPDPRVDWSQLPRCVQHHRLAPLLGPLLQQHALLPAPVHDQLQGLRRQAASEALACSAELVRVTAALEAAGIDVLALKGPALSALLYGDPSRRSMRDIDLLLRPAAATAARAVLADCGYGRTPESVDTHLNAVELRRPDRPLPIELHVRLADDDAILPIRVLRPFETAATVMIAGRPVRTLGPEAAVVFAAFHGTKHLWARLFWLADLAAASRSPQVDWDEVTDLAGRLGIRAHLETGLLLLGRLLLLSRPGRLPGDSRAASVAERAAAAMPEILTVPPVGDHHAVRRRIGALRCLGLELALLGSWTARWATLRSRAKPTLSDRRLLLLPARLDSLYYAVRVARVAGDALRRTWRKLRRS